MNRYRMQMFGHWPSWPLKMWLRTGLLLAVCAGAGGHAAGVEQTFDPEMVLIRGGSYIIGSPGDEPGRFNDERLHRVHVNDFYLATHEVTRGNFRLFVDATGYLTDAERNAADNEGCFAYRGGNDFGWRVDLSWRGPGYPQRDDHPVVCVSWHDAVAYLAWLRLRTGTAYRLPTEAEWEVAARATSGLAYGIARDAAGLCKYGNIADRHAKARFATWTTTDCDDGYVFSAPIGRYQPNPNGLYDMHGNVWEWTCSASDSDYSDSANRCAARTDGARRALRGGSFSYGPRELRLAFRNWNAPGHRFGSTGFRIARTPEH